MPSKPVDRSIPQVRTYLTFEVAGEPISYEIPESVWFEIDRCVNRTSEYIEPSRTTKRIVTDLREALRFARL